jgi:hypothetical protein
MNQFENEWREWAAVCLHAHNTPASREALELAFYSGAMTLARLMQTILTEHGRAEAGAALADLQSEMRAYADSVRRGRSIEHVERAQMLTQWNEFPETKPPAGTEALVIERLHLDSEPRLHTDYFHAPTDEYPQGRWDSSDWLGVTHWAPYPTLPTRDPKTQSLEVREYLNADQT